MNDIIRRVAIASLIAAVLNTIVFFVATQVSGTLIVNMPAAMDVTFAEPLIFTVLLGVLGGSAVGYLALRTAQPKRTWVTVAIVALVLYGIPPFASAGVITALWFNVMHAVAGLILIPAVASALPEKAQK